MHTASILLLLVGIVSVNSYTGCRDDNNNVVDWFYAYKAPKNKFTRNDLIKKGVAYFYITPETLTKGWTMSTYSVNDSNSMIGKTLGVLYQNANSLSVIYNDQPPDATKDSLVQKENSSESVQVSQRSEGAKKILTKIVNFFKEKTRKSDYFKEMENNNHETENQQKINYKSRSKKAGGGHTKGVVVADSLNGFWMIHSVPKYPPIPENGNKYSYPETGTKYGQSYLCISLSASEITKIGEQLKYNEPNIVYSNVPWPLKDLYSSIADVLNGVTAPGPPWYHIANLTTAGKTNFMSFAKSARFNKDIYEELVAPTFDSDLKVETWRNGRGALDSECKLKYRVNNIDKIAFPETNIAFSSHSDHSKWAVSVLNEKSNCKRACNRDHWICVGDINRAQAQETRGGGTVCTKSVDLWNSYTNSINAIEDCQENVSTRRKPST